MLKETVCIFFSMFYSGKCILILYFVQFTYEGRWIWIIEYQSGEVADMSHSTYFDMFIT